MSAGLERQHEGGLAPQSDPGAETRDLDPDLAGAGIQDQDLPGAETRGPGPGLAGGTLPRLRPDADAATPAVVMPAGTPYPDHGRDRAGQQSVVSGHLLSNQDMPCCSAGL